MFFFFVFTVKWFIVYKCDKIVKYVPQEFRAQVHKTPFVWQSVLKPKIFSRLIDKSTDSFNPASILRHHWQVWCRMTNLWTPFLRGTTRVNIVHYNIALNREWAWKSIADLEISMCDKIITSSVMWQPGTQLGVQAGRLTSLQRVTLNKQYLCELMLCCISALSRFLLFPNHFTWQHLHK